MTSAPDTPADRSLRARIAAHKLHAQYDGLTITAAARASGPGSDGYWEQKIRADRPDLPDAEVVRRAGHLKSAYYSELARKSNAARRKPPVDLGPVPTSTVRRVSHNGVVDFAGARYFLSIKLAGRDVEVTVADGEVSFTLDGEVVRTLPVKHERRLEEAAFRRSHRLSDDGESAA